jgi:hypothetical protein
MLQVQRDQQDTQQFWLAQLDADRQVLPFAVTGLCPVGRHFGAGRTRQPPESGDDLSPSPR